MENNEITIDMIRNMDETAKKFIDEARKLTDDELDLLIRIVDLIIDRPDRVELVNSWTGKMKDLPDALARI